MSSNVLSPDWALKSYLCTTFCFLIHIEVILSFLLFHLFCISMSALNSVCLSSPLSPLVSLQSDSGPTDAGIRLQTGTPLSYQVPQPCHGGGVGQGWSLVTMVT